MTPSVARLHVLLASENDSALIIRRGPTNQVAVLDWDRYRDTFKLGQWLKGRIYEDTCDLSPDGRHFLYQAKKYEPKAKRAVFYSVMARAPYLKALHFWAHTKHVYGGAFFDNTRFWLVTYPLEIRTLPHLAREKGPFELDETITKYDIATYRRQRDGWILQPNDYQSRKLWHKTLDDYTLALSIYKRRNRLPNIYELKHGADEIISSNEWTWADLDIPRKRLCFARDGQLWSLPLKAGAKETLLHDFNAMQFEPRVAPY